MKKAWIVAALCSTMLLTGCGSEKENTKQATNSTEKSEQKTEKSTDREQKIKDLNKMDLPQLDKNPRKDEYVVEIKTTEGNIKARLFPKLAPKAVENFVSLAKEGYYDGLTFHRVINNFMIQTGDPKGDGTGGESKWKKPFDDELNENLYNLRGAIAMANSGPDTNGSQFFINQNKEDKSDGLLIDEYPQKIIDAYKKGGNPDLDYCNKSMPNDYTVFGQVISGMNVVDKIAATPTDSNDKPKQAIKIRSISILQTPKKEK